MRDGAGWLRRAYRRRAHAVRTVHNARHVERCGGCGVGRCGVVLGRLRASQSSGRYDIAEMRCAVDTQTCTRTMELSSSSSNSDSTSSIPLYFFLIDRIIPLPTRGCAAAAAGVSCRTDSPRPGAAPTLSRNMRTSTSAHGCLSLQWPAGRNSCAAA